MLIESFARGRGVVASRVGGIPDVVRDGVEGLLVDPLDDDDISRALIEVLSDRELAERLGAAARDALPRLGLVARRLRGACALARRPCGRRNAALIVRLAFVTQAIDSDDPNLAVAVDWVRALAARCDEVRVIADRVRAHDLPANVSFADVRLRLASGPRRPLRACGRRGAAGAAPGRDARAHGPAVPHARGACSQRVRACRCSSGTRTGAATGRCASPIACARPL